MKPDAALLQVVEHRYQVAQAAAQPVELPHYERVAFLQRFEATEQGRALDANRAGEFVFKKFGASGLLERRYLHGGVLVVGADTRIADFHAVIMRQAFETAQALISLTLVFVSNLTLYGTSPLSSWVSESFRRRNSVK